MSADQRYLARILDWDSNFFGFRIAQAIPDRLTEKLARDVVAWCAANDVRCLYFLAAPDDPETAMAAAKYGFHPVDIRVTMDRDLNDLSPVQKIRYGAIGRKISARFAISPQSAIAIRASISTADFRASDATRSIEPGSNARARATPGKCGG